MTNHPLWREITWAIVGNGGNVANLSKDITRRVFTWLRNLPAAVPPAGPPLYQPAANAPATGPP